MDVGLNFRIIVYHSCLITSAAIMHFDMLGRVLLALNDALTTAKDARPAALCRLDLRKI